VCVPWIISPLNIGKILVACITQTDLPRRWTSARFRLPHYTDRFISPLNIGEIFCAFLYRQIYLAAEHRRDFDCLIIQTDLSRRWTSTRFFVPYYTDRYTSPLNIGEISVASLYRQIYLAAEHRRDFLCPIIQTDIPRCWTSVRFRLPHYTDRFISPLNIGEIFCAFLYRQIYLAVNISEISVASLYRQIYLAAEHRQDFLCLILQRDLSRRWTSVRFFVPSYTDRFTSPLNIGEICGCLIIQTDLSRRWTSARFFVPSYTDRYTSPLNISEIFVRYIREIKLTHIRTFT